MGLKLRWRRAAGSWRRDNKRRGRDQNLQADLRLAAGQHPTLRLGIYRALPIPDARSVPSRMPSWALNNLMAILRSDYPANADDPRALQRGYMRGQALR
jgi:hypothetical protein